MGDRYIIGLDVGTSVTKAALFDRAGRKLAATSLRTAVLSPHAGWYEMEPDELFDAACAACRELMAAVGIASRWCGRNLVERRQGTGTGRPVDRGESIPDVATLRQFGANRCSR
ncbi:hypothetical protein MESS2_730196 [Mesorhizobium metallidurans STM 2683]|uniref:Carbohydrate kinase FGGY N-terminal domain-containing protein n=1 Tax=Mesorhizobium metallidurans STM 2683 TaxID=1297569 RepID=M5EWE6_9HYPH|nr:hypothetical protein MESS2_730196 [Mesorhizobium metallidurans STM 2683]